MLRENVPDDFKLEFEAGEIDRRIAELSKDITNWVKGVQEQGKSVTVVCILCGGDFFLSDLRVHLPLDVRYGFIRTHAYKAGVVAEKLDCVSVEYISFDPAGEAVLLVDDICDSGGTLQTVDTFLKDRGAHEIKSAVLVNRKIENSLYKPDWAALHYGGTRWLAGRGMQREGLYRGARNIYSLDS